MMDGLMMVLYGFCVAYHALRGSGLPVCAALWRALGVGQPRRKPAKPICEFQKDTWRKVQSLASKPTP